MKKIATLILFVFLSHFQLTAQCDPDTEPPVVVAVQGLTVTLLATCQITLWATDFLDTLSDNCTPGGQIEFAIRKAGTGAGFPTNPDGSPQQTVHYMACDLGTNFVELWARDLAGNAGVDSALVIVQENSGACDCFHSSVNACAFTVFDDPIEEVRYDLCAIHPALPMHCAADIAACAFFSDITSGAEVTLVSSKNNDPLNGVSTFDLVLINKHILGQQPFDQPYQFIAADANNSRTVSTFDIVELRKLILGYYTALPGNTSWRFLPKDYVFPNPANPLTDPFPDSVTIPDLYQWNMQVDFTGIKIGDINGNAQTYAQAPAEERLDATLRLADAYLQPGQTTQIPLHFSEARKLLGLQFALAFDPAVLEISSIALSDRLTSSQPITEGQFYAQPQPGLLTLSWDDPSAPTLPAGAPLLFLEIKARQALQLSQALRLKTERLRPELYTADGTTHRLALDFSAAPKIGQTRIFPAAPNPATGPVVIPVALAEPTGLLLEIFDLNGRLVHRQEFSLDAGLHRLEIPGAVLARHRGVLPYRVRAGGLIEHGKLICP
ncbi:MAG: hypothetical protein R3D58_13865 [Saprospiraceae bacterium]